MVKRETNSPKHQHHHNNKNITTDESFRQNPFFAEKILPFEGIFPTSDDDHDIRNINRKKVEVMLYGEAIHHYPAPASKHLGRAGIKQWIWENKVVPNLTTGILHEYMKRSLNDDALYFYGKYVAIVELQQTVVDHVKLPLSEIFDEHFLDQDTLLYLAEHAATSPVKRTILRFLENASSRLGRIQISLSLPQPSRKKKEFHPKILQFQQHLEREGLSNEYKRHCIGTVQELFTWICSNLKDFSDSFPHQINILRIQNEHLLAYRSFLLKQMKIGASSPITVSHKISQIRGFFMFLNNQYGYESPLRRFRAIKALRYHPREIPSNEQIETFYQVIDEYSDNPIRDQVAYRLMLQLGMRLSEVANVCWSDINLATRTISIHSKGQKSHLLPLAGRLYECIQEVHKHQLNSGPLLGRSPESISNYLYRNYKLFAIIAGWTFPGGVHFFRHRALRHLQ